MSRLVELRTVEAGAQGVHRRPVGGDLIVDHDLVLHRSNPSPITPAFVMSKYLDILTWNALAGALLADLDHMSPRERNYVRMVFTNPRVKDLYYDWESNARSSVAVLRMQAVENPNDPRLAALIGELSVVSPQFRRWWADRHVAQPEFGTKTIRHPERATDRAARHPGLPVIPAFGQRFVLLTAERGRETLPAVVPHPGPGPHR